MHRTFTAILFFAALRSVTLAGDPVPFSPSKDNTLYEDVNGQLSNGQGPYFYAGQTIGQGIRRGLIAFNLSAIPTNATITGASFSMVLSRTIASSPVDVSLRKMLRDWGEGASNAGDPGGGGVQAEPGDATWLHTFYDTGFWTTPGGDFSPTVSATTAVIDIGTTYTWTGPGLVADVQSWVSNPATNLGWIIRANEVDQGTAVRFGSRENTKIPPLLSVTFQAPTPTPTPTPGTPTPTPGTPTPTPATPTPTPATPTPTPATPTPTPATPTPTPATPTPTPTTPTPTPGTPTPTPATPTPTPTPGTPTPTPSLTPSPVQALNISTRMRVETGSNVMIAGFIVTGNAPKEIAVRGIGPSLTAVGVNGALADPTLELRDSSGTLIIADDDWQDDSTQAAQLTAAGLALQDPKEAGIVATLQPDSYTAILAGKDQTTGVALVEVYDINPAADSQLANISTRGFVLTGSDVMIGGFILGGNGDTHVVTRGIGPSLAKFGIGPVLEDPIMEVRDSNGALLVYNDNWQDDPFSASQLSFLGLAPSDPKEAGIYTSLPPGAFTTILAGTNGGTGIGLLEIYNVH